MAVWLQPRMAPASTAWTSASTNRFSHVPALVLIKPMAGETLALLWLSQSTILAANLILSLSSPNDWFYKMERGDYEIFLLLKLLWKILYVGLLNIHYQPRYSMPSSIIEVRKPNTSFSSFPYYLWYPQDTILANEVC